MVVPSDCSPERLMQLVREGQPDALDQITRCYSDRLLEAGRRHCRTGTEAEDAVQDAWLTATQRLTELRDDAKLVGWLVKVVASACRRIGRGRKNDGALHDPEAEPPGASDSDPEAELAGRQLGQLLERARRALAAGAASKRWPKRCLRRSPPNLRAQRRAGDGHVSENA